MGRHIGTQALSGGEMTVDPLNHIALSSVWADDMSWSDLTGRTSVDT